MTNVAHEIYGGSGVQLETLMCDEYDTGRVQDGARIRMLREAAI